MKVPAVLLSFAILASAACHRASDGTAGPATEPRPPVEPEAIAPPPASTPAATPDPAARHRDRLLARIDGLNPSDCDTLVLEFQIIPRDEILNPLSEPKKELLRYVKRIASAEDLAALERAIDARQRHSAARPGAMSRTNPDRKR